MITPIVSLIISLVACAGSCFVAYLEIFGPRCRRCRMPLPLRWRTRWRDGWVHLVASTKDEWECGVCVDLAARIARARAEERQS